MDSQSTELCHSVRRNDGEVLPSAQVQGATHEADIDAFKELHNEEKELFQSEGSRDRVPLPFVRLMRLHIDGCAGTNKSQYSFGGLGVLATVDLLDAVFIAFMVPGHSKFGPDKLAQPIATVFNRSDVFNSAMLLRCASSCSSPQVYDETNLYHWKCCSQDLFGPVDNIMTYRQFFIMADDGAVDVGEDAKLPSGLEPFPGSAAPLRHNSNIMKEASRLAARSLQRTVPEILAGTRKGGIGGATLPDCPAKLQPSSVDSFRRVRLFMRRNESEPVWREQKKWMKEVSLSDVNKALEKLVPYSTSPSHGREFYGAKLKGIKEQYSKYVPPMFVPDNEEINPDGLTAGMGVSRNQTVIGDYFPPSTTESEPAGAAALKEPAAKTMRWNKARDLQRLGDVIVSNFEGKIPRSAADVKKLAELMPGDAVDMPWDGGKLRKKAIELQKQGHAALSL